MLMSALIIYYWAGSAHYVYMEKLALAAHFSISLFSGDVVGPTVG